MRVEGAGGRGACLRLDVFLCDVGGTLPKSVGHFSDLESMEVDNNVFSGSLPDAFESLKKLTTLTVFFNSFSGKLLYFIAWHTPAQAWLLLHSMIVMLLYGELWRGDFAGSTCPDLSKLILIGSIPSSIFGLSNLINLDMDSNSFTGTVPESIAGLTSVIDMTLNDNQFTGVIPSGLDPPLTFSRFDNFCDFSGNNFSCPLPKGAKELCNAACN